ncbi:MAG: zinc ribbon domain-containing protein [Ruminococcus sp.]|nr:zinc ribbon domain-containing protein [Ruminococcus sp.]MCM1479915.1 zinc ribbon domain-containing protein [Muribaculaceae bacterium]
MYCKNCGKLIEDDADFCTGCGLRVKESEPEPVSAPESEAYGGTVHSVPYSTAYPAKVQKSKAPIVFAIAFIAIVVLVFAFSGDKYVKMVKGGCLDEYPNMPIGAAFDDYFHNPDWTSFETSDGRIIVEFNGVFEYFGKSTTCTFQFEVHENSGDFEISYAGIGDETMGLIEFYAILEDVEEDYLN